MKYIILALKSEAQAFVEKFKLNKTKTNDELCIIVSGVGKENMYNSTIETIKRMKPSDKIANVGICAGSKKYNIGELIHDAKNLTCVDTPIYEAKTYELVDMESVGFLEATSNFTDKDLKNVFIFKVVSDHFEPESVTKDKTKKLIYAKIDEIIRRIDR